MTIEEYKARQARAYRRSIEERVVAYRLSDWEWAVPAGSKPGEAYTVMVGPDQDLSCNCRAGEFGHPCKHREAVATAIIEAAAREGRSVAAYRKPAGYMPVAMSPLGAARRAELYGDPA